MMVAEVQQVPSDPFVDEAEGIELVNRRIAQIRALRARITELAYARSRRRTVALADELALTVFRLYEARFMLDQLMVKLKRLRDRRARTIARTLL
jgi:hypothetical protein